MCVCLCQDVPGITAAVSVVHGITLRAVWWSVALVTSVLSLGGGVVVILQSPRGPLRSLRCFPLADASSAGCPASIYIRLQRRVSFNHRSVMHEIRSAPEK